MFVFVKKYAISRGVFFSDFGPTIAILIEYDALPEIGHACGHNLIAEAGIAAAIAIKALIDTDPTLIGKVCL